MRELVLYGHIILGLAIVILSVFILMELKKKSSYLKPMAAATAFISWLEILPAGILYLTFYPATKTVIKAGPWPWAHSIVMETKEHWGLLLPVIATVAAWLVYKDQLKESKKWWILLIALTVVIGIMGRIIKMGAVS